MTMSYLFKSLRATLGLLSGLLLAVLALLLLLLVPSDELAISTFVALLLGSKIGALLAGMASCAVLSSTLKTIQQLSDYDQYR